MADHESTKRNRKDTRTIQLLDYLVELCDKPLGDFYKFVVGSDSQDGCTIETIENMLKRVPSVGRDREIAQGALHSALDHLYYTHKRTNDQATRDSAAKSAQSVLRLVVMNVSNTRENATLQTRMAEAVAAQQRIAQKNALEAKRIEEEKQYFRTIAYSDNLTGCFNQRYMEGNDQEEGAIMREINEAKKYQRPLSLIVFDMDNFKRVNDGPGGHPAGNYVLKEMAATVRDSILRRETDIFGRYGGDELVVLLPETDESGAVQTAENIRKHIQNYPFTFDGKPIPITVSLGVKQYRPVDTKAFFTLTDACLYAAKKLGRNRVVSESVLRERIRDNIYGPESIGMSDDMYAYFRSDQGQYLKATPPYKGEEKQ
jgi:diguanylate cyclase (GGDEF)-like protein